jgi:hypothetical protein
MAQTVIIRGASQRDLAKRLIDAAPIDAVVTVKDANRTNPQNDKMWAMISDVSRAKPDGRRHTPDMWKALFMKACGHHVQFVEGLDGEPFPVGFRSSRLTVRQMADLITFIQAWGDERGVAWSDRPVPDELQRAAG